ncbi:MAG: hypothetical protein K0R46_2628, partial [Herbinix sp.]|nr:hypothetical protein [Herbinix sp.]
KIVGKNVRYKDLYTNLYEALEASKVNAEYSITN